jgi:hypothetical protein
VHSPGTRIVFLDFDGVLNQGYDKKRGAPSGFDYSVPSCVLALNALTRAVPAKIVVSSSWRIEHPIEELRGVLRKWGVEGEVIDVTPDLEDASGFPAARIVEIRAFLDMCSEPIESFVVLDDQDIRLDIDNALVKDEEIEKRFVRTVTEIGFTSQLAVDAARALALLRHP